MHDAWSPGGPRVCDHLGVKVILLGPPGSDVAAVAAIVAAQIDAPAISIHGVIQWHARASTLLSLRALEDVAATRPIPDNLLVSMVAERLAEADTVTGFVLHQFPHSIVQARLLDEALKVAGILIDVAVRLILDPEQAIVRRTGRRSCSRCGERYHVDMNPAASCGICPQCGGQLMQRHDDTSSVVTSALHRFTATAPYADRYYRNQQLLVPVDAGGTATEVATRVLEVLTP